jgi:isoquinoline 1-oxidoreductase beta subunit
VTSRGQQGAGPECGRVERGVAQAVPRARQDPRYAAKKAANAEALKSAAKTIVAEYDVPFLAHAAMEPLNCTVEVKGENAEIWVGSQFQTVDQRAAAEVIGAKPEQVKLNTMLAGGGFGRRANPASDYIARRSRSPRAPRCPSRPSGPARTTFAAATIVR